MNSKRIKVRQLGNNLKEIEIIPSRTFGNLLYPFILFIFWIGGYFLIIDKLQETGGPAIEYFIIILSSFWLVIATFVTYIILWKFFGKEIIYVSDKDIKIKKTVMGISKSRTYKKDEISLLSLSGNITKDRTQSMNISFFGITGGSLSFVYNGDIKHFGLQLSPKEAEEVLLALQH